MAMAVHAAMIDRMDQGIGRIIPGFKSNRAAGKYIDPFLIG